MHFSLTSAATLPLLAAIDVQAYHVPKFAITAHFLADGNCDSKDKIQSTDADGKGVLIKDGDCEAFPEFRAFKYDIASHRPLQNPVDNPAHYGICALTIWSGLRCGGEPVFEIEEANDERNFGKCWGNFSANNQTVGRSISVGKCMSPAQNAELEAGLAQDEAEAQEDAARDALVWPPMGGRIL